MSIATAFKELERAALAYANGCEPERGKREP